MPFDFDSVDTGATAWVLASAALVLLMTPGLAFFYSGMVRAKHALAMLMQNYVTIGIVSLVWVVAGFSLAFGKGNGFIGDLHFAGLQNIGDTIPGYVDNLAQVVPPMVFVIFQLMFAVITPALITGSTADRWKFGAFVPFIALWSILVYAPVAHWVFSPEGWLFQKGALDFAGGTVVHINAGVAGLALAIFLVRRRGWPGQPMRPHNVPFVLLGAGLLWFGWFGFNAGSELAADNTAAVAFVNTIAAPAAALLAWLLVEKIKDGKPTSVGAASGAVAGLVAITPACASLTPIWAIVLGFLAGAVCAIAIELKFKWGFDDSLDVVGIHLVGGLIGTLYLGFFANGTGLIYSGNLTQLLVQAIAAVAVLVYSFVLAWVIGFAIQKTIGFRVKNEDEIAGIDTIVHGEEGYVLADIRS